MPNIIPFFPHLVAREKAKRGNPDQANNATPLTTLVARHFLLALRELPEDMTIAWALGYHSVNNLLAMEMWVAKHYVQLPPHLTTAQLLEQLKKMLRDTLGHAANDGLYMPADFLPSIFKE